ncbi:MAG: type I restriction enzyme HsdR N-terminal domain-containing protein [Spirulina sp. SIO3F2]|nr:type I restriction enzyme HsdR N-terminal domain-containing protein [Spirulina sp. SIO3F2]
MPHTIPASAVGLNTLETTLGLQEQTDPTFFSEWQTDLPELGDWEKQSCDRVRLGYFNLLKHPPVLENAVRLTVLHPLLFIANFYVAPLHVKPEKTVSLNLQDEDGTTVEGRIDALVLQEQLWLLVIEAKQAGIAIEAGIAQLLSYMLANPTAERPSYGMITNGGYFQFAKVVPGAAPQYALSDVFVLRRSGNELYPVVQIMKKLVSQSR